MEKPASFALAEIVRRGASIKEVAASAGEVVAVSMVRELDLSTEQLIDALSLLSPVALAAWNRIESERIGEIDQVKAREIMQKRASMPPDLRDRVQRRLLPILKPAAA